MLNNTSLPSVLCLSVRLNPTTTPSVSFHLKETSTRTLLNVLLALLMLLVSQCTGNTINTLVQESISNTLHPLLPAHISALVISPLLMRVHLDSLHTLRDIDRSLSSDLRQVSRLAGRLEEGCVDGRSLSSSRTSMG